MCYDARIHNPERLRDLRAFEPPPPPEFFIGNDAGIISFLRFTTGRPYPPGYFDEPVVPTRLQRSLERFVVAPARWLGGVVAAAVCWLLRFVWAQVLPAVALFAVLSWLNYAIYGDDYDGPGGRPLPPLA